MSARRNKNAADQSGTDVAILDADYSEHDTQVDDDQDAIEREILNEAGASENQVQYEIRVFRIPESGNTYPSLFTIPGENVAGIRDRLAQEYGTGHYELRVYKNKTLYRRLRIKIELPRTPQAVPPNNAGDAVAQAVLQQGKMLEALVLRLANSPPPPPAPVQSMADMFKGMAEMAAAMKIFFPAPAPPVDPLQTLGSVIELVKNANSEGREKGMLDLVGDFINSDLAKSFAQQIQQPQPQAQPPRAIAPPTAPAQPRPPNVAAPVPTPAPAQSPASASTASVEMPDDKNTRAFNNLLSMLIDGAIADDDPALYADLVEVRVAPEMLQQLLALPDPVGALANYRPEIATYRPWLLQVIEALTEGGEGETTGGAQNSSATAPDAATERTPAPAGTSSPT